MCVHLLVGDQGEIPQVPAGLPNRILFGRHLPAAGWRFLDREETVIGFPVFFDKPAGLKFIVQAGNPLVEGLLVISALLDAVVQMDIDAPLFFQSISLVRLILYVIPFRRDGIAISSGPFVVIGEGTDILIDRLQMTPDELEGQAYSHQELDVLPEEAVDVGFREEALVHDELGLAKAEDVQVPEKVSHCHDIRDVPGQLAVVERQAGLLPKHEEQVNLRQFVVLLVPAPLNLPEGFGIAGDGGTVVGPVFFLNPPPCLEAHEPGHLVVRDGGEQLAAPGGRNVLPVGMLVGEVPFLEPVQRVAVFKDKKEGNGKDFLVGVGEACPEVVQKADVVSEALQEVGGAVIQAPRLGKRLGAWLCWSRRQGCRFLLLGPAPCRDDLTGDWIDFPDTGAIGPGLLLLFVPVVSGLIGIRDAGSLVGLGNDGHGAHLVMFI